MVVDKVFYTNGHDVMVTDTSFTVKKKQYRILGITDHAIRKIKPLRMKGLFIVLLGALITLLSTLEYFSSQVDSVILFERVWSGSQVLLASGIVIALIGLIWTFAVKPRYAVHISTAEGDTDVVVSSQREYVRQIVNALNRAVMALKSR
jgi:hypothetical protein